MKILVIGSGGREHAIVWALKKTSRRTVDLYCAPGNAGIAELADCVSISATDIVNLAEFASENAIDLTFVGPEAALALGIVDEFNRRGLTIVGPSGTAAKLEASKGFAKDFMKRHGVPLLCIELLDLHRKPSTFSQAENLAIPKHLWWSKPTAWPPAKES